MQSFRWLLPFTILTFACLQCRQIGPPAGTRDRWTTTTQQSNRNISGGNPIGGNPGVANTGGGGTSLSAMMREVNLKVDMVRAGTHGRKVVRPMRPRYITIHSTQNYTAGAAKHALALKNGALRSAKTRYGNRIGYLIWHFTVDQSVAIQHMPTNEQGEHADFGGPGNRLSIGIEMCENRGNSRSATTERTAKLTACLMKRNGIPLCNVVPHYHWPRRGKNPPNKNCPHFLMDNGRPGAKWRGFLGRVNYYYRRLNG